MPKVPIVQLFDTRQQKRDCKTQKVGKTEPIDVIERHFVGISESSGVVIMVNMSFYMGVYYMKV
jgi:hypothetical protein